MEKGCENCRHKVKKEHDMPCVNCIRNARDKWEPEQPTIEPYGTWIPVTERLPEDSRDVILTTRSLVVGVGCVVARDGKWAQWYSGGGILVDVIAWMPYFSPLPYREEKKDE